MIFLEWHCHCAPTYNVHWSNWKDFYFLIPDNYRPTPIPNIDFLFRSDYSTYSYTCITGLAMSEILVLCGFFMIYIVEEVTHVMVDKLHRGMKRRVTDVSNWIEKDSTVRARNFKNSAKKKLNSLLIWRTVYPQRLNWWKNVQNI